MKWIDYTLASALDEQAARYGDKDLLVTRVTSTTYQGAREKAEALARAFVDIGIKKGDNVAVWMSNCVEWVYTVFALAKIGACSVPLNTRWRTREVDYALGQSDSTAFFFGDRLLKIDFAQMVYEMLPGLAASKPGEVRSERYPKLRSVISVGERQYAGMYDLAQLMEAGTRSRTDVRAIQDSLKGDDIGMIQYTSGTTAFPKGAMLRHGAMLQNGFCVGERWLMTDQDRVLSASPFYHNAGSVLAFFNVLTHGATQYTLAYWNAEDALRMIQDNRVTIWASRAVMVDDVQEVPGFKKYDLSSLRLIHSSGSTEYLRDTAAKFKVEITSVYGLTEASPNVCEGNLRDPLEKRALFQGKPHPGMEMKIIDLDTKQPLPPGQKGEICVRGWSVTDGYYRKPEETAKAIDKEGWLHTGDLGILNEEGYLTFKGRMKNIIRCGGENVSAEDVEDFLRQCPKVKEVQVISVPDKRMTEVVMAVVEPAKGQRCTEQEIIDFCRGKLANYKVPRYVRFVTEWPETSKGTIERGKLKDLFAADFESQ